MYNNLSIVIPCLNEGNSVEKMVPNIIDTVGLDQFEIIIINSGGTDTSLIRDLPCVRIHDSRVRLGAPEARNLGSRISCSDSIIFCDAHVEFKQGWGSRLLEDMENNENSIITPCMGVMGNENVTAFGFKWSDIEMNIDWLPCLKTEIYEIPFAPGGCMAMRKRLFDEDRCI